MTTIDDINDAINKINEVVSVSGSMLLVIKRDAKPELVAEAIEWLKPIMEGGYAEYIKVYKQHPPEAWATYKALGETSIIEVRMLTEARNKIKRTILSTKRPRLFRVKSKKVKS